MPPLGMKWAGTIRTGRSCRHLASRAAGTTRSSSRADVPRSTRRIEEVVDLLVARNAALDFGCGLGRLTQALATHFASVTGVDIAGSMVEGAQARNVFPDRVSYVVNTAATLPFDDASFDFVYSVLVLQHVPPPGADAVCRRVGAGAAPGGVWPSSRSSRIGRRRCATRCGAPSHRSS